MFWIERVFASITNFFAELFELTSEDVIRAKIQEGLLDKPEPQVGERQTIVRFSK